MLRHFHLEKIVSKLAREFVIKRTFSGFWDTVIKTNINVLIVHMYFRIYLCISYLPKLLEQLSPEANVTALKTMIINPLKEFIEDMDKFQQLVEQTIDLDAAEKGDFMVNPGFADDLKGIYNLEF